MPDPDFFENPCIVGARNAKFRPNRRDFNRPPAWRPGFGRDFGSTLWVAMVSMQRDMVSNFSLPDKYPVVTAQTSTQKEDLVGIGSGPPLRRCVPVGTMDLGCPGSGGLRVGTISGLGGPKIAKMSGSGSGIPPNYQGSYGTGLATRYFPTGWRV